MSHSNAIDREHGGADGWGGPLPRACVTVGSLETWYARWGRGDTTKVVLLREPLPWVPEAWLETLGGGGRRLLFPEMPPGVAAGGMDHAARRVFSLWLFGFLDGLGLERVEAMCEPELAALLRSARREEPDRFSGPSRMLVPPYRSSI